MRGVITGRVSTQRFFLFVVGTLRWFRGASCHLFSLRLVVDQVGYVSSDAVVVCLASFYSVSLRGDVYRA